MELYVAYCITDCEEHGSSIHVIGVYSTRELAEAAEREHGQNEYSHGCYSYTDSTYSPLKLDQTYHQGY